MGTLFSKIQLPETRIATTLLLNTEYLRETAGNALVDARKTCLA